MSFEQFNLDARLNAAIKSAGFVNPTPIQEQAIPFILEGRDVMGLAQTGTGKTAAFMLPILQKLTQGPLKQMRALVIAPTRELAEQINQATRDLTRNTKIRSAAIYGGVKKKPQIKALNKGTEIIIATPGRLLDLTGEGHVDYSHIEFFVLDEADRLFDMGFLPDIQRIIRKLPQERQTLFFSATMPKVIRRLANEELKKSANGADWRHSPGQDRFPCPLPGDAQAQEKPAAAHAGNDRHRPRAHLHAHQVPRA